MHRSKGEDAPWPAELPPLKVVAKVFPTAAAAALPRPRAEPTTPVDWLPAWGVGVAVVLVGGVRCPVSPLSRPVWESWDTRRAMVRV